MVGPTIGKPQPKPSFPPTAHILRTLTNSPAVLYNFMWHALKNTIKCNSRKSHSQWLPFEQLPLHRVDAIALKIRMDLDSESIVVSFLGCLESLLFSLNNLEERLHAVGNFYALIGSRRYSVGVLAMIIPAVLTAVALMLSSVLYFLGIEGKGKGLRNGLNNKCNSSLLSKSQSLLSFDGMKGSQAALDSKAIKDTMRHTVSMKDFNTIENTNAVDSACLQSNGIEGIGKSSHSMLELNQMDNNHSVIAQIPNHSDIKNTKDSALHKQSSKDDHAFSHEHQQSINQNLLTKTSDINSSGPAIQSNAKSMLFNHRDSIVLHHLQLRHQKPIQKKDPYQWLSLPASMYTLLSFLLMTTCKSMWSWLFLVPVISLLACTIGWMPWLVFQLSTAIALLSCVFANWYASILMASTCSMGCILWHVISSKRIDH